MTIETAIEVILNDNDLEVTPYMVSRLVDRFEFSDEQITVPLTGRLMIKTTRIYPSRNKLGFLGENLNRIKWLI